MLNLYVSLVLLDVSFTMLHYNLLCLVIYTTVLRWHASMETLLLYCMRVL